MIVFVVAGGLVVAGCDAVWMQTGRLEAGPHRMSADTLWARSTGGLHFLPMNRCDVREIRLLGWASDAENPMRQVLDLTPLVFRPGDINFDGVEDGRDLTAFMGQAYDYNLDGRIDSSDLVDVMTALYEPALCE